MPVICLKKPSIWKIPSGCKKKGWSNLFIKLLQEQKFYFECLFAKLFLGKIFTILFFWNIRILFVRELNSCTTIESIFCQKTYTKNICGERCIYAF